MEQNLKQEARDLLDASKWTQAEAARQLGMTPSAFSQIIRTNSPVNPSRVTLKFFRLLVEGKSNEPALEKWEIKLIDALHTIPLEKREVMAAALIKIVKATK